MFDLGTSRVTVAYCVQKEGTVHVEDFISRQYANDMFRLGDIMKPRQLQVILRSLIRDFSARVEVLPSTAYLVLNLSLIHI